MAPNTGGEGQIRKAMIQGDVVEVMIGLPGQLFSNTQIPACLWFLTNDKAPKNGRGRDRHGETLFIDARQLGTMETRVLKTLTNDDIAKIAAVVHRWKKVDGYVDIPGFCKSAELEDIEKNAFVLTPGRYVGAEKAADDGIPFEEKMAELSGTLRCGKGPGWMHYINARQNTSHDYSEADCVLAIVDEFYPDVINLYQTLSGEGWNIESKP